MYLLIPGAPRWTEATDGDDFLPETQPINYELALSIVHGTPSSNTEVEYSLKPLPKM